MKLTASKTLVLAALAASSAAFAQTKAPEPDYTLSYNIGAVTDYRYRGISQSFRRPALQGGIDYAHKSGFYLGTWASSITWIKDSTNPSTTHGPVEIDLYGGYKTEVAPDTTIDVGLLQYWYPNNNLNTISANADTLEAYAAVSYKMFTLKISDSLSNLFGAAAPGINSRGSTYADLSAAFDLGNGWSITPHIGNQVIHNFTSYTDYSLTLAKDFDGLVVSAALVGTNWKHKLGAPYTYARDPSKDMAGNTLVVGIKKNF